MGINWLKYLPHQAHTSEIRGDSTSASSSASAASSSSSAPKRNPTTATTTIVTTCNTCNTIPYLCGCRHRLGHRRRLHGPQFSMAVVRGKTIKTPDVKNVCDDCKLCCYCKLLHPEFFVKVSLHKNKNSIQFCCIVQSNWINPEWLLEREVMRGKTSEAKNLQSLNKVAFKD